MQTCTDLKIAVKRRACGPIRVPFNRRINHSRSLATIEARSIDVHRSSHFSHLAKRRIDGKNRIF